MKILLQTSIMLFIQRENLCIYSSEEELRTIQKSIVLDLLLELPSNTIYFETPEKLYGMISYGDILKAEEDQITINKAFLSMTKTEYMKARQVFRNSLTIREIPVTDQGHLIGEFHYFDDELLLSRFRGFRYNADSDLFFSRLHNVALVRPASSRAYKRPYFESMQRTLEEYQVSYTIIDYKSIPESIESYSLFLLVDEQELRGARLLFDLFTHQTHYFYKILTYYGLQSKLESSEVMNYEETLKEFTEQGVSVLLLTARHNDRAYTVHTEAEMKARFPFVPNNLNELMKPFEKGFFDDLYENREYVENIKQGYFSMEKDRAGLRLSDTESKYVNVRNAERFTANQPEDYTRTIYFFGPCLVIGSYVGDAYTVESFLQKKINETGYKVRVVNCGCWGGNVASINRMISAPLRKGDMLVVLLEDLDYYDESIQTIDLWDILEKYRVPSEWLLDMPFHMNHHVAEIYASELFQKLFPDDYQDNPDLQERIHPSMNMVEKFYINKYFYGMDLSHFKKASCCAIHGNPFTNGHRYLVETASRESDHVFILTVMEDSGIFSFGERYAMAVDAVSDLDNVTVIPSGQFIGNVSNFHAYFVQVYEGDTIEQARSHAEAFASIASLLHVKRRYLGEEPDDPVADEINKQCVRILPEHDIQPVILKRKDQNGRIVSGSVIRELAEKDAEELRQFVPSAVADIIRCESLNTF